MPSSSVCLLVVDAISLANYLHDSGRKEILDGMLAANLVCFQTYSYSRHFISSCIRVCGYETTSNQRGIDVEGHVAAVNYSPVGIDSARVARDILRPGIQPKLDALRALYEGKKIIVGRDKLDVVKGVVQKVSANLSPFFRMVLIIIPPLAPSLRKTARGLPTMGRKGRSHSGHLSCPVGFSKTGTPSV